MTYYGHFWWNHRTTISRQTAGLRTRFVLSGNNGSSRESLKYCKICATSFEIRSFSESTHGSPIPKPHQRLSCQWGYPRYRGMFCGTFLIICRSPESSGPLGTPLESVWLKVAAQWVALVLQVRTAVPREFCFFSSHPCFNWPFTCFSFFYCDQWGRHIGNKAESVTCWFLPCILAQWGKQSHSLVTSREWDAAAAYSRLAIYCWIVLGFSWAFVPSYWGQFWLLEWD